MKKVKMVIAFLFLAIITVVFAGCGSDSSPTPGVLTITTTSPLAAGTVGTVYGPVTLVASGGTAPYTWALATGSLALPTGLTLSTAGVISGTPSAAGTVSANITVTDAAAGTFTKALSITVNAAGTPAVPAAPTGVIANGGTNSVTITWPAVTGATSYNIYWSATTGVTTANTKITGVTSPYKHSRLTATPTWLAANTPYFFIVTAVNATGESAASTPQTSATTSATDGVALYGTNCQSCHSALFTSAKHDRTAAQIQAAITSNTGGMGFLSTLSAAQVQAISDVLVTGF